MRRLRAAYARRENVMDLLRDETGSQQNSTEAVLTAYDLQAGTYRRLLSNPEYRVRKAHNTGIIAEVLSQLPGDSLLDAGVGEATTLGPVLHKLNRRFSRVAGFDLSWSRLAHAREYLDEIGITDVLLFTGDLMHIPVADETFDIVFTSHALEPNHEREREVIAELARISRRWIVLFEPSYEHGSEQTREAITRKGYVRGLADAAKANGLAIVRDELAGFICSPGNETGLLILKKEPLRDRCDPSAEWLVCPLCKRALLKVRGNNFCPEDGLAFPILDDLPCLLAQNGVLATQFVALDSV